MLKYGSTFKHHISIAKKQIADVIEKLHNGSINTLKIPRKQIRL